MPHIGMIMERSLREDGLRERLLNLVARSVGAALGKRDITSQVSDAKTAFSSWDNCMNAVYCKWPAIALMIIGGLILFSILWCIIRCACCGLSCCCECCYCLKCCGDCCGCCDPPRGKRSKYLDEPFVPPHQNIGYQPQAPMLAGPPGPLPPKAAEVPQYAQFDSSTGKDADSLPAMPSWNESSSKKVLVEEDSAVELESLKKPEHSQDIPLMSGAATSHPPSPSPISPEPQGPLGAHTGQGPAGYMGVNRYDTSPYGSQNPSYNNLNNGGYRQPSPQDGSQGYGRPSMDSQRTGYGAPAGAARQPGRPGYGNTGPGYGNTGGYGGAQQGYGNDGYGRSQDEYSNGGGYGRGLTDQGYGQSRSPRPYNDEYAQGGNQYGSGSGRSPPPASNSPYADPARRQQSPGPQAAYGGYGTRSPPNNYNRGYPAGPQRQYSSDTQGPPRGPQRQYTGGQDRPGAPSRQYSTDPQQPMRQPARNNRQEDYPVTPTSPIQNNAGFDFNSGYSRPQTANEETETPQQAGGGGAAYPGYRAYKPAGSGQNF